MKLLFWCSAFFIAYTYVGYPLWLLLLLKIRNLPIAKSNNEPAAVSVVIAVHNEEKIIRRRLQNLLIQDYPSEKLEIIVVSDGSTDNTFGEIEKIRDPRLKIIHLSECRGKAASLNEGIAAAKGDVIVFADARQTFALDAIRQLSANFSDPRIGCVSGELILLKNESGAISDEMGAYWKYEKRVRSLESETGSVVGATGAIYAIRRSLYESLPIGTLLDDVLTPLNVVSQGYRCILDMDAQAYDVVSKDLHNEWPRKVRTLAGNWQLVSFVPEMLLPWRNPCWWRLLAHKIFRLIVPFFLITLLITGLLIFENCYKLFTCMYLLMVSFAFAGLFSSKVRKVKIISFSYFFLAMNAAAVAGAYAFFSGNSTTVWKHNSKNS